MLLEPHNVVRDAARIARLLADQARCANESDHAVYFERVAAAAECRAARLRTIQWTWQRNRVDQADGRGHLMPSTSL